MWRFLHLAAAALAPLALASCVAPAPRRAVPAAAPPPVVALPAPPPSNDWRDWPLASGTWTYAAGVARFGRAGAPPDLILRCDAAAGVVTLARAAPPSSAARTMQLTTSDGIRALAAAARPDGATVSFATRDPFLDRLAFSRGRIVVALSDAPRLVVPAWAEIGRVVEDCRG